MHSSRQYQLDREADEIGLAVTPVPPEDYNALSTFHERHSFPCLATCSAPRERVRSSDPERSCGLFRPRAHEF
jgi:hypothetical protein